MVLESIASEKETYQTLFALLFQIDYMYMFLVSKGISSYLEPLASFASAVQ
jgi:hypothetical protein